MTRRSSAVRSRRVCTKCTKRDVRDSMLGFRARAAARSLLIRKSERAGAPVSVSIVEPVGPREEREPRGEKIRERMIQDAGLLATSRLATSQIWKLNAYP